MSAQGRCCRNTLSGGRLYKGYLLRIAAVGIRRSEGRLSALAVDDANGPERTLGWSMPSFSAAHQSSRSLPILYEIGQLKGSRTACRTDDQNG